MKQRIRTGTIPLTLLVILASSLSVFAHQPYFAEEVPSSLVNLLVQSDQVNANHAPVIGSINHLYDGSLGTLPADQGFLYADPSGESIQSLSAGVTTFDTTAPGVGAAGYSRLDQTLDRSSGLTIRFTVQVASETHNSEHRAGFSIIAISSDGQYGIELGFWENEIWAQEGGEVPNLFTHAEGATFDTTTSLVTYELTLLENSYALNTADSAILSGALRDYTAFVGFPDVYETSNFIFIGDDTTSAQAEIRLSDFSVITDGVPSERTIEATQPLAIDDIGIFDLDAAANDVSLTLAVNNGTLSVPANVPGGLSQTAINGNGTAQLRLTGTVGAINTTLTTIPTLSYQSNVGFSGDDPLSLTMNDNGHSDGAALIDQKVVAIVVSTISENNIFLPLVLR